jgi:hypothetical protein
MPFIFIDRRKAGGGKSTNNRQKLIRRVRGFIKTSVPQNIGAGGVSGTNAKSMSPVKVTGEALEEPFFAYANDGNEVSVVIGNDQYDRGDEIEFPEEQAAGSGAGPGEQGEDDFIVNVARSEFLDVFFEDCELYLTHERFTEKLDNKHQPAGFSTTGNPSQLSIIRTYKQSLGRRWALMKPYKEELEQLREEIKTVEENSERWKEIVARIEQLLGKLSFLDSFDKSDLRYRKKEAKPLKTVDAVLIMLMDISGSMGKEEKSIARRWFALLYEFIKRKYPTVELRFIAHTDEVFEMNEDDFFSTRINGGTQVSVALNHISKMIIEQYDPNQTNIIVCHASDGDNWYDDNEAVIDAMIGKGNLMNRCSMFSYVEVGNENFITNSAGVPIVIRTNTNLWETYDAVRLKQPPHKVSLARIGTPDDCYPVFKKVFSKKSK